MKPATRLVALIVVALVAQYAHAQDTYYRLSLRELTITDGALPDTIGSWQTRDNALAWPRIVLDGEGEAHIDRTDQGPARAWERDTANHSIYVRLPQPGAVTGRIFLVPEDADAPRELRFSILERAGTDDGQQGFHRAKAAQYDRLQAAGLPGSAWFRHQADAVRAAGGIEDPQAVNRGFRPQQDQLLGTFDLFTGGRAISENLQLDRVMPVVDAARGATVDLASIEGITLSEMDWQAKIGDAQPALDPLAAAIPADQHAIFFPSVPAAMTVLKVAEQRAMPAIQPMEPRSEAVGVRNLYERQIGLRIDDLAEIAQQHTVTSLAVTGSDPYLPTGTDIAVLLATDQVDALHDALVARIAANRQAGLTAPDAASRSLLGKLNGAVVLTNSSAQMQRLAAVRDGQADALAALPEYTFFRHRYALGAEGESAFLMLTDATIRRWCGPKWRIAASRRTRAAAVLYDLQARHADAIVQQAVQSQLLEVAPRGIDLGEVRLTSEGVRSSIYGTTAFLTPIAELDLERVTEEEAAGYQQWRDGYQRNWSGVFDPIGLRLAIAGNEVRGDLTVMPLIGNSDYRQMIALMQGARIGPAAGDPHDNVLMHIVYAINNESEPMQSLRMTLSQMAPGIGVNPLGWLGESVAIYVDEDPVWREMGQAEDTSEFLAGNFHRLPIALHAEVNSGLKLTAFLAAVRTLIEQSAPGMTIWTPLEHNGQPYVRITPSEAARSDEEMLENLAVYYVASNQGLVVTLHEGLLHRAIDRQVERRQQKDEGAAVEPAWLGESVAARVQASAIEFMGAAELGRQAQQLAWSNIPILNEWKRLYPDQDPVHVHARLFNTTLVCPGGGEYTWNADAQTMQSTVYGHPTAPQDGPGIHAMFVEGNFGITFEDEGLRAKAHVQIAE